MLRAMKSPKSVCAANFVATLAFVAVAVPATRAFGVGGMIFGIIVADLFILVVSLWSLRRLLSSSKAEPLPKCVCGNRSCLLKRVIGDNHKLHLATKRARHMISKLRDLRYRLARTKLREPLKMWQHRGLKPEDVYLASFGRCGSTWLRFVLLEIFTGAQQVSLTSTM